MSWAEKPFITLSDLEKIAKPQRESLLKQRHIWKWNAQSNRLLNMRHADNIAARVEPVPGPDIDHIDFDDPFVKPKIIRPKAGKNFYVYQRTDNGWDKPSGWLQMRVVQWDVDTVFVEHPDTLKEIKLSRRMLKNHGYDGIDIRKPSETWFYTAEGVEQVINSEDKVMEMLAAARASRAALNAMAFALDQGETAILPIPSGADKATIMRSFRERAKLHHPDHGGNADDFRRLCAAKDKALAAATLQQET